MADDGPPVVHPLAEPDVTLDPGAFFEVKGQRFVEGDEVVLHSLAQNDLRIKCYTTYSGPEQFTCIMPDTTVAGEYFFEIERGGAVVTGDRAVVIRIHELKAVILRELAAGETDQKEMMIAEKLGNGQYLFKVLFFVNNGTMGLTLDQLQQKPITSVDNIQNQNQALVARLLAFSAISAENTLVKLTDVKHPEFSWTVRMKEIQGCVAVVSSTSARNELIWNDNRIVCAKVRVEVDRFKVLGGEPILLCGRGAIELTHPPTPQQLDPYLGSKFKVLMQPSPNVVLHHPSNHVMVKVSQRGNYNNQPTIIQMRPIVNYGNESYQILDGCLEFDGQFWSVSAAIPSNQRGAIRALTYSQVQVSLDGGSSWSLAIDIESVPPRVYPNRSLPSVSFPISACLNNRLFLFHKNVNHQSVYHLYSRQCYPLQLPFGEFPQTLGSTVTIERENSIYIIGGANSSFIPAPLNAAQPHQIRDFFPEGDLSSLVVRIDVKQGICERRENIPIAVAAHTTTYIPNLNMWVLVGGVKQRDNGSSEIVCSSGVYSYSLQTNRWNQLPSLPIQGGLAFHTTVLCGKYLIVYGGRTSLAADAKINDLIYAFRLDRNEWVSFPQVENIDRQIPKARWGHAAYVAGGDMIVTGGWTTPIPAEEPYLESWIVNCPQDSLTDLFFIRWQRLLPNDPRTFLLSPRGGFALHIPKPGQFVVYGGRSNWNEIPDSAFNEIIVHDMWDASLQSDHVDYDIDANDYSQEFCMFNGSDFDHPIELSEYCNENADIIVSYMYVDNELDRFNRFTALSIDLFARCLEKKPIVRTQFKATIDKFFAPDQLEKDEEDHFRITLPHTKKPEAVRAAHIMFAFIYAPTLLPATLLSERNQTNRETAQYLLKFAYRYGLDGIVFKPNLVKVAMELLKNQLNIDTVCDILTSSLKARKNKKQQNNENINPFPDSPLERECVRLICGHASSIVHTPGYSRIKDPALLSYLLKELFE